MKKMGWSGMLLAALMQAGCATMQRGATDKVTFESDPPGAAMHSTVKSACGGPCPTDASRAGPNGEPYPTGPTAPEKGPECLTPCVLELPRNKDYSVTFSKLGYQDQTVDLIAREGEGGAAVAGNFVAGGLTGVLVDSSTKAAYDHQPNPLKVVLQPIGTAKSSKPKHFPSPKG